MINASTFELEKYGTAISSDAWKAERKQESVDESISKTRLQFAALNPSFAGEESLLTATDSLIGVGLQSAAIPLELPSPSDELDESTSIYFRKEPITSEWRRAVRLLDHARGIVSASLEALNEGKVQESDEKVMDFKEYLHELFCLRSISESFGNVINAIGNGLTNKQGVPLDQPELLALDNILQLLLREPAMSFERSVELIMRFEDSGFAVESAALGGFLDLVRVLNQEFDLEDVEE